MALDSVQDFLHLWPGWATLAPNHGDTYSQLASGETRVWELREHLWQLTAATPELKPSVAARWEALLESLENGKQLFWGYDLARRYPILYPNGTWPTGGSFSGLTAAVNSINANRKALRVKTLPAAYAVSAGDMLQITHSDDSVTVVRAMEDATADGAGLTPEFEVRPHLPTVAAADDDVAVKRPAVRMIVVPGSYRKDADPKTGRVQLRFEGMEALEVPA